MALALVLAMALVGFSIKITSTPLPIGMAAAYVGYAYHKAHWATKRDPRVIFILGSTGQIILIPVLMTPMTYVAASANFPLVDAPLMALDRALGLDWMAQFNFIYSHHALLYWCSAFPSCWARRAVTGGCRNSPWRSQSRWW